MRKLVFSALLLASAFQTAFGQTYSTSGYSYTLSNNQATIIGYFGADGAVSIPNTLNSYPVVSIGSSAFRSSSLTSVSIPYGVTSIGSYAFADCLSRFSVSIPNSVTMIGQNSFAATGLGSVFLGSVFIPSTLASQISQAGFPSTAVFYYEQGQWTYIVENGGATITRSTATGDVTIPSVLGGYAV